MAGNKKPRKKYNPHKAKRHAAARADYLTQVTFKTIYKAANDSLSENMILDILAPLHMALAKVGTEDFTAEDFVNLNRGVITCWNLASRIYSMTQDAETKALMDTVGEQGIAAADALHDIGRRFFDTDDQINIATEEEKAAVGRCLGSYEELLNVSTSGHVLTAIEQADLMVDGKLEERMRVVERGINGLTKGFIELEKAA